MGGGGAVRRKRTTTTKKPRDCGGMGSRKKEMGWEAGGRMAQGYIPHLGPEQPLLPI